MAKPKAKTLADYKAVYDPDVVIPAKIRAALTTLLAEGPENWEYEADFFRRVGAAGQQITPYREQFAAHVVEPRGHNSKRIWFADTKVAAKARGG